MVQFWVHPESFGDRKEKVLELMSKYPCDAEFVYIAMPGKYREDNNDFAWLNYPKPEMETSGGMDEDVGITDWNLLDGILDNFPDPEHPALLTANPPDDGRYRLGYWWFSFFERLWSLRGMTNALTDFYEHPEEVHRFFDKLCRFYSRAIERAVQECKIDGILITDDLGTQSSTFFSEEFFEEFFKPYYSRLIDRSHELGIHLWLHSCGHIKSFIPKFIDIGLDVLHPIQKYSMDEREIARKFGKDICFWAGFDVQQTIPWGTPEDVRKEVRFMIDTYYRPEGRLMLTAGNGINEDCTLESLEALFDEIIKYGSEKCGNK